MSACLRDSLGDVPTLVCDPPPAEFEALLERRRRLGQDVDPHERRINWFALQGDEYRPVERSALIALSSAELAEQIDWPG
jgi:hypothetical protein